MPGPRGAATYVVSFDVHNSPARKTGRWNPRFIDQQAPRGFLRGRQTFRKGLDSNCFQITESLLRILFLRRLLFLLFLLVLLPTFTNAENHRSLMLTHKQPGELAHRLQFASPLV